MMSLRRLGHIADVTSWKTSVVSGSGSVEDRWISHSYRRNRIDIYLEVQCA